MDYDIEADWKLLDTCNYRCPYCFHSQESLGRKLAGLPLPRAWIDAFAATDRTWLLHITGGEPGLFPGFGDLCAGLAERHFLSVNTNLTRDGVIDMARRVPPARVSLIHAALHHDERARRQGWAVFAANLDKIRDLGQPLVVSVVATPEVLERSADVAAPLERIGIRVAPKLFRGGWEGRTYPHDYTSAERAAFARWAQWARDGYAELIARDGERPTVWPLDDDMMMDARPTFRGLRCDAGRRFVAIHPDGRVYRCGEDDYLGNLLSGDFAARAQAQRCTTSYCYYFCRKHSIGGYHDLANAGGGLARLGIAA